MRTLMARTATAVAVKGLVAAEVELKEVRVAVVAGRGAMGQTVEMEAPLVAKAAKAERSAPLPGKHPSLQDCNC